MFGIYLGVYVTLYKLWLFGGFLCPSISDSKHLVTKWLKVQVVEYS